MIDLHPVVRLKQGFSKTNVDRDYPSRMDPVHFGTRTDYLCAHSRLYDTGAVPFWFFDDDSPQGKRWLRYWQSFEPKKKKPSTGLLAVFMALDNVAPQEIALIGFDRVLNPDNTRTAKWYKPPGHHGWGHDAHTENRALHQLPVKIIDIARGQHGEIS